MTTFISTLKHLSFLLILLYQSPLIAEVNVTYYIPDASGSPVAATDEQGNLKWRKHYRPFGEEIQAEPDQTNSKNNHIGYTGHVQDKNTGLTYMRARYYDPVVGRFMAMDPAAVNPNDPRAFNRYAYANNNPYKFVDPDGQSPLDFDIQLQVSITADQLGVDSGTRTGANAIAKQMQKKAINQADTITSMAPGLAVLKLSKLANVKKILKLPKLDGTGKMHGDLPHIKDLKILNRDTLKDFRDDLGSSIKRRKQVTKDLGVDPGHSRREAAEENLIKSLNKFLDD